MDTIEEVVARLARAGHTVTFVSGPYRGADAKTTRKGYVTITATINPPLPSVNPRIAYVPSHCTDVIAAHAATSAEAEAVLIERLCNTLDAIVEDNQRFAADVHRAAEELLRDEQSRLAEARRYGAAETGDADDTLTRARAWLAEQTEARREMKQPMRSEVESLVMDLIDLASKAMR